jgi:hypothetical protein
MVTADEFLENAMRIRAQVQEVTGEAAQRIAIHPVDWEQIEPMLEEFCRSKGCKIVDGNPLLPQMMGLPVVCTTMIRPGVIHIGKWQPWELGYLNS